MKVFLLLLLITFFSACSTDINDINNLTENDDQPFEIMENAKLLYSDSAVLKVKLITPLIQRFSGNRNEIVFPNGIDVSFYSDGINIQSTLQANYAIKKTKTDITEIKENVILKNFKGDQLNTEHLIWDEKNAILKSEKEVTIITQTEIIKGTGFEADQEFNSYKINNITGTILLNENEEFY